MSRHLPVHPDEQAPRLADHPRARRSIARTKAWGGLVGLVLALVISLHAHLGLEAALVRGLAAGIIGLLATWATAVVVWTQLARSELEAHRQHVAAQWAELTGSRPDGTS